MIHYIGSLLFFLICWFVVCLTKKNTNFFIERLNRIKMLKDKNKEDNNIEFYNIV